MEDNDSLKLPLERTERFFLRIFLRRSGSTTGGVFNSSSDGSTGKKY